MRSFSAILRRQNAGKSCICTPVCASCADTLAPLPDLVPQRNTHQRPKLASFAGVFVCAMAGWLGGRAGMLRVFASELFGDFTVMRAISTHVERDLDEPDNPVFHEYICIKWHAWWRRRLTNGTYCGNHY